MKRNWWLILIIVIALALTFPYVFKTRNPQVAINGKTYSIETAQTDAERAKGLSGRDSLAPDTGMLFIFPSSDIYPFWMKETKIPLDIMWLAPSEVEGINKVVEMTTLQPPSNSNIPTYTPQNKANYVLELNAGSGVKVGDEVKINW